MKALKLYILLTTLAFIVNLNCVASVAVTVHSEWQVGGLTRFYAQFQLPITQYCDGWKVKLVFNKPTMDMEIWDADVLRVRNNGKVYILINKFYNAVKWPSEVLDLVFLLSTSEASAPSGTATFRTSCNTPITSTPPPPPPTSSTTITASTKTTTTTSTTTSTASTEPVTTTGPSLFTTSTTSSTITTLSTSSTTTESGSTPSITTGSAGYNYSDVVEKSILFFEAQRSGDLPATNRIPWRGDSALGDAGDNGEPLTGGWYDAGDSVKFGFPMAYSATTLAWGLVTWPEVYQAIGQTDEMLDCIKWPLDYFLKAHTANNELYVQVGDADYDHRLWIPPEVLPAYRPAYKLNSSRPGSDVAAETAAAFAAGYMAFKSSNLNYANTLLTHARQLYAFANKYRGKYSDVVTEASKFYRSWGYEDELAWAATWLYKATGELSYLTEAENGISAHLPWASSWDDKTAATQVLLYQLTNKAIYRTAVESFLSFWKDDIPYTPKGLAYRLEWGPNRYAAAAAVVALMAADAGISTSTNKQWARNQIHYMLGDGGKSYVVGFGANFPLNPHHAAASCPDKTCGWRFYKSGQNNAHELTGALVGGPDINDNHNDVRSNIGGNEPACDYNAVFQTAVVGLMGV